ncbi:hypothetical protein JKP88DRAFT_248143 [Tribonema minus]|uniref:BACK domain-containing protein n=1 Tax=Tribonema minus TaxID=303371 RepID=A0A835YNR7_9STRA|nr:hypothetical protein JKP88DRAFT_248143 [Tribonema minus]
MWCMYHGKLPAGDMTVPRALSLARLADAYAIENVLLAATQWLNQQASLTCDDALSMVSAPYGVCERLQERALDRFREQLGDLDLAMNITWWRGKLMALPEAALIALLSDDRLAVAAESTVAATAVYWSEQQGLETVPDAVAGCIRLRQLHPAGFIATVAQYFPQWTPRMLALLWQSIAPTTWTSLELFDEVPQVLLDTSDGLRRASCISAAKVKATVSLSAIQARMSRIEPKGGIIRDQRPTPRYYGGYWWNADFALCFTNPGVCSVDVIVSTANGDIGDYMCACVQFLCNGRAATDKLVRCEELHSGFQVFSNFFDIELKDGRTDSLEKWANKSGDISIEVIIQLR